MAVDEQSHERIEPRPRVGYANATSHTVIHACDPNLSSAVTQYLRGCLQNSKSQPCLLCKPDLAYKYIYRMIGCAKLRLECD